MSRIMLGLAGATALGAALVVALPPPLPAPTPEVQVRPATARRVPSPPPTENFLDESAEREQKSRRKQWFRERHRAPEGVDWVAIERENGRVQLAKRNALAAEPPAPARWVERGSDNQAGRMHVIRHDPSDPDGLYAGSSLGGVWRGTRDGAGWTPIGDNLYGGAHWLEVYPGEADDPPIVLAATDWGSVHRSVDDGATWTVPEGFDAHDDIDRLLQLRDDDLTTFAIARSAEQWRVLRSTDAGASFQELWNLGVYEPDLWAPRDGGTTLYLAAQDHVWTSVDLGETWTELGAYAEGSQRAEITGSEAGAPRLYVMVNGERLAVSDDAGESFTPVDVEIWDYWGRLAASSEDPDLFTWGGVEVHITRDGAESFDIVNSWPEYYSAPETKLHADVMGLDVVPTDDGELWYVNTDGGPYVSEDGLRSVQNLGMRGLRVKNIVRELSGEKIDIIRWSPDIKTYAINALSPAKLSRVEISDSEEQTIHVTCDSEQLSLAIGKRGQNVRLSAKLLGWKIDIQRDENDISFEEKVEMAVTALAQVEGIDADSASKLVHAGFLTLDGILAVQPSDLVDIAGLDDDTAAAIHAAAMAHATDSAE